MNLLDIQFRNFKGFKNFRFTPNGKNATVFGDNGTGKTTIYDGVSYLLFDKDSLGQGEFNIKPTGMVGSELTPIECEVEATFTNGMSGGTTTLKKILVEKYTKKRGSALKEMTGHETQYFVDSNPVSATEYKAKVAEMSTKDSVFKLLTDPIYFNEDKKTLKMADRRAFLFEICGGVSDEEIISMNPDLAELPKILAGKSGDDFKRTLMARRKKINESLEGIPTRVDEVLRGKPADVDLSLKETITANLEALRSQLDAKNQEIARVNTGGGIQIIQNSIGDAELKLANLQSKVVQNNTLLITGKQRGITEFRKQESLLLTHLNNAKTNRQIAKGDKESAENKTQRLRDEYGEVDALEFTGHHCPYCSQTLPADKLEEAKTAFNLEKSKKLETIVQTGTSTKNLIAKYETEIKELDEKVPAFEQDLTKVRESISALEKEIAALAENNNTTPEIEALKSQIQAFNDELATLQKGNAGLLETLGKEKGYLEFAIAEKERVMALFTQVEDADKRIAELSLEQKTLAAQFEETAKHLNLIETFIRKKASMLEDHINSKFRIVKFRLFREQINGGIEEICEAEVDGVPYNALNHAKRIHAGLDIIRTVGNHYNFRPVVFVDGKESLTTLPEMDCQVICLHVSEPDKKLRVVVH